MSRRRGRRRRRRQTNERGNERAGLNGATPPGRLSSPGPVLYARGTARAHAGARSSMRDLSKYFPTRYRWRPQPPPPPPLRSFESSQSSSFFRPRGICFLNPFDYRSLPGFYGLALDEYPLRALLSRGGLGYRRGLCYRKWIYHYIKCYCTRVFNKFHYVALPAFFFRCCSLEAYEDTSRRLAAWYSFNKF